MSTEPLNDEQRDLVERNMGLAVSIARRYSNRGEPFDDLRQVAWYGLVRAALNFDPERGVPFYGYASKVIFGEIKRYFRDVRWKAKVRRKEQESYLKIQAAFEELVQRYRRNPTWSEIADEVGISLDDLGMAMGAAATIRPTSIETESLNPNLAEEDAGFDGADAALTVKPLLATLPAREQEILRLRFVEGLNQDQIATIFGISQMHVSRLIAQSLKILKVRAAA